MSKPQTIRLNYTAMSKRRGHDTHLGPMDHYVNEVREHFQGKSTVSVEALVDFLFERGFCRGGIARAVYGYGTPQREREDKAQLAYDMRWYARHHSMTYEEERRRGGIAAMVKRYLRNRARKVK
jgi:hypothetical protein